MFGCHSLFFFFSSLRSSTLPLPHSLRPTPTSHSSISTYSIFFFRPQSSFFQCGEHFWPIPGFKCAGGRNSSSYYGSLALLFAYRRSERLLKVSKTSCKLSLPHCPVKLLFFIAIPCVGFLFLSRIIVFLIVLCVSWNFQGKSSSWECLMDFATGEFAPVPVMRSWIATSDRSHSAQLLSTWVNTTARPLVCP